MTTSLRWPAAIIIGALAALSACDKGHKAAGSGNTATGSTKAAGDSQVVARVGGEEITVHQLNAELATIPSAAVKDPKELQKEVLRAIVFRTAMRQAATKEKLDRDPQISLLLRAAQDKLLADAYLKRETGTTPPPTVSEVDQFIVEHPLQFDDRRIYQLTRLTMAADQYSDLMVPMFDEKETFADLEAYLNEKSIQYTMTDVRVPSSDFPAEVQGQLAHFKTGDNVVVRGPSSSVILKIKSWVAAPVPREQAREIAQNMLYQQSMQKRARSIQEALPNTTKIEFVGPFAGVAFIEQAKPTTPPAAPQIPQKAAPGVTTPVPGATSPNGKAPDSKAPATNSTPGQGGGQ
jgi:EpsD family peptidyl-prolyl cis-trans isomerase